MRKQFILAFLAAFLVAFGLLALGGALERANAQETPKVAALFVGANGIWNTDGDPFKADLEAAVNGRASLSPHLSAVGSVAYGFAHSYFRGTAGVRATVTDVANPNWSVGLGISYWVASDEYANEWKPEAAIGWVPAPERWPNLTVVGLGFYGLDSTTGGAYLGVRTKLNL